ncbi:hypothetical protein [Paenibacillus dauci]|uniref:hypothetical protein n=1 Tax=Paenibacillus dauci TaxID=1567106 RepID=UPI0006196260|nr:hypothetical protein [Paenibacillus dauci]
MNNLKNILFTSITLLSLGTGIVYASSTLNTVAAQSVNTDTPSEAASKALSDYSQQWKDETKGLPLESYTIQNVDDSNPKQIIFDLNAHFKNTDTALPLKVTVNYKAGTYEVVKPEPVVYDLIKGSSTYGQIVDYHPTYK